MKVLITKLSSMGDLIHLLPALTDAYQANKNISFDWIIDKNFAEVASWHPAVDQIIVTNHRVWRRNFTDKKTRQEMSFCKNQIKKKNYDLIIDAQGNLKSALISLFAKGPIAGFDGASIPEWGAHFVYKKKAKASKEIHAIERLRNLFSQVLDYPLPTQKPNYNINTEKFIKPDIVIPPSFFLFVPIASYSSKLWPEHHWQELIKKTLSLGLPILLPWGNEKEKKRAESFAMHSEVLVLPKLCLSEIGYLIQKAKGMVSLDTGLSHLAAALGTPNVTLYGPTDPIKTGTIGNNQIHMTTFCPCLGKKSCQQKMYNFCLEKIAPEDVLQKLVSLLSSSCII